jgi:hypothetical protein
MSVSAISQQWIVYNYADLLSLPIPKRGEHVLVANAPPFSTFPIIITGDGQNTWAELIKRTYHIPVLELASNSAYVPLRGQTVGVPMSVDSKTFIMPIIGDGSHNLTWLSNQAYINTATVNQMLVTEISQRQAEIIRLESLIGEAVKMAEGAGKGIVFDDTAQIDSWIAGIYVRPDGDKPADLKVGTAIFTRAADEPSYFWDGTTYIEQENEIDLSGYRSAADQDVIDSHLVDGLAPILSPAFEGIPTVPTPDGSEPAQAVPYQMVMDLIESVKSSFADYIRDLLEPIRAMGGNPLACALEYGTEADLIIDVFGDTIVTTD